MVSIAGRTRFDLSIRLELASGQKLSAHAAVLREDGKLALESPALARGCYPIERLVVETRHPFGLVVRRSVLPVASGSELVVYPDPGEAFEGRTRARLLQELVAGGEAGAGDLQPSSLRDHRAGDGTRGIHWRASARRGRLVVREWDGESGSGREVVLDRRSSAAALERALATVSTLVELAREKKESLRLVSQGLSATFGEAGAPWAAVLRFLAGAEVVPPDGPAPPPASRAALRLPRAPRGVAGVR